MIGIAIERSVVRCALVRSGLVRWSRDAAFEGTEFGDALSSSLRDIPPAGRKSSAVIALGPEWCQMRLIEGFSRVADSFARTAISSGVARYFLKKGGPLVTTGAEWIGESTVLAAAFERSLVDELSSVCSRHSLRLDAVVPLAALARPGEGQSESDHALAAARLSRRSPLAYRPHRKSTPSRREVTAVSVALICAALLFQAAPGIAGLIDVSRARRDLATLGGKQTGSDSATAELRRLGGRSRVLAQLASARPQTILLARLAELLPEDAFLSSLRTDSTGGSLVVIAQNAQEALEAVQQLPGVAKVEVSGSIMRQGSPMQALQRFTVRFAWSRTAAGSGTVPRHARAEP